MESVRPQLPTPPPEDDEAWRQARSTVRVVAIILAALGGLLLGFALRGVLLLIVVSIFFAYLLAPIVETVQGQGRRLG